MAWILFENTILYLNKDKISSVSSNSTDEEFPTEDEDRSLALSDARIALIFVSKTGLYTNYGIGIF